MAEGAGLGDWTAGFLLKGVAVALCAGDGAVTGVVLVTEVLGALGRGSTKAKGEAALRLRGGGDTLDVSFCLLRGSLCLLLL